MVSHDAPSATQPARATDQRVPASDTGFVWPLLITARPRQWIKNIVVFSAPVAAGEIFESVTFLRTAVMFVAFVAASASTYFLNDALDVAADRLHPVKSHRPVAAGAFSVWAAYAAAAVCAVAALVIAALISPMQAAIVGGYLAMTVAYSTAAKHIAVLDILVVAAGFVLRAVGGATASHIPVSNWFLLVTLFGALFLVSAKRYAEQHGRRRNPRAATRRVLSAYPMSWLQQMMTMSLTACVLAYALWAVQYVGEDAMTPMLAASLIPFLGGMMRYSLLAAGGDAEAPEVPLTCDRFLLVTGALWAATVGAGIYLG